MTHGSVVSNGFGSGLLENGEQVAVSSGDPDHAMGIMASLARAAGRGRVLVTLTRCALSEPWGLVWGEVDEEPGLLCIREAPPCSFFHKPIEKSSSGRRGAPAARCTVSHCVQFDERSRHIVHAPAAVRQRDRTPLRAANSLRRFRERRFRERRFHERRFRERRFHERRFRERRFCESAVSRKALLRECTFAKGAFVK